MIATTIYFAQTVLALISCFVSKEEKEAYRQRQQEKQEERDAEDRALREYEEILKSPGFGPGMPPHTPATAGLAPMPSAYFPGGNPQSPFLGGYYGPKSPAVNNNYSPVTPATNSAASDLPLRNAAFDAKPASFGTHISVAEVEQPYFPPPPKKATK